MQSSLTDGEAWFRLAVKGGLILVEKFTLQVALAVSLLTLSVHYIMPVLTVIFPLIVTISVLCNYLFWTYHGMAGDYREVLCVLTAITVIAYILMAL